MEDTCNNTYEAPVMNAIGIKQKSIICASGEVPDMEHGWDLDF